jgi:hypothetical protein
MIKSVSQFREEETVDESKSLEFVSGETVQEIVLWIYKTSLRLQYFLKDVFSWKDSKLTVKAILFTFVTLILSFLLGDAVFLWLISNLVLLTPIAY